MLPMPHVVAALLALDQAASQSRKTAANGPVQNRGACENAECNQAIKVCLRGRESASKAREARACYTVTPEETCVAATDVRGGSRRNRNAKAFSRRSSIGVPSLYTNSMGMSC